MSDARLRELERRWRRTGAVDDEALYLAERARAGDLAAERLALAAALGHEAARRAAPSPPATDDDQRLVKAVSTCGVEALVRAQVALARWSLGALAMARDRPPEPALAAAALAIGAAEAWLRCPCDRCVRAAQVAADQRLAGSVRFSGLLAARHAALMVGAESLRHARRHATFGLGQVEVLRRELVPWLLGPP
ncbi:MAG: hypothetical protein KF878_03285 [Planctomycetes bacterium]|nr:hypothetical protein [Planctomycetota bacterium]